MNSDRAVRPPCFMESAIESSPTRSTRGVWRFLIPLACVIAFPSTGFVQKYGGMAGVFAYVAGVVACLAIVWKFLPCCAPWLRKHFRVVATGVVCGLLAGYVGLHPLEDNKGPGKSSDRDEALELAVSRMGEGKTPYYPDNKIAGPLSLLPGSILLAAPFVALGDVGYQNVFWLAAFLLVARRWFRSPALALALLLASLALSPAALYEFISGGDMLANGIFVALLLFAVVKTWSEPLAPAWMRWGACCLLGIGLASRANFFLLTPLLGMLLWRQVGFRQAFLALAVVGLVAAGITVPFYLNDPAGFTPLLARQKLSVGGGALPWAGQAIIAATLLTSWAGAWRLWRSAAVPLPPLFFRWCARVTVTPMIGAVLVSSWIHGRPDFEFMRDRFGLMFVGFGLFGWGGRWLQERSGKGDKPLPASCGKCL